MTPRSRELVARALAHRMPERIPFSSLNDPQVRELIESLALPPDRRQLLLEGVCAFRALLGS